MASLSNKIMLSVRAESKVKRGRFSIGKFFLLLANKMLDGSIKVTLSVVEPAAGRPIPKGMFNEQK